VLREGSLRPMAHVPAFVIAAGERAPMRFLEFFAPNIRNPHTRRGRRGIPDLVLERRRPKGRAAGHMGVN
jgi:hypothetical protein